MSSNDGNAVLYILLSFDDKRCAFTYRESGSCIHHMYIYVRKTFFSLFKISGALQTRDIDHVRVPVCV